MRQLIFILVCSFILSCKTNKVSKSPACKEYVDFIKTDWKFDKEKSLYYFEGNPEFWDKEKFDKSKFVNSGCLLGIGKEGVIKLFGTPTRNIVFNNQTEMLVYCQSENCLDAEYVRGKSIVLNLDDKQKVVFAYFTPTGVVRSH